MPFCNRWSAEDPETELREIVESIHLERAQTSEPLFVWKYRLPIFLAITIGMFNQLSGINAILYYLNDIFAAPGYSKVSGDLQAVAIGAMNLVATLFGMSLIDKLGRKTLLIIGAVGTALCLAGVADIFYTQSHQNYLLWLLVELHRVFCHLPGRGHLGIYRRSISRIACGKGQALGSFFPLDHERPDRLHLPPGGQVFGRLSVHVFRGHDGGAVFRGPVFLPGNKKRQPGADAAPPGHRLASPTCCTFHSTSANS